MNRITYAAIFTKEDVGGYSVYFPDVPGCYTEGDTLEEAQANAKEALELHLYCLEKEGDEIPAPSEDIAPDSGELVVLVTVWMDAVRDEMRYRAVKKTLTIPQYLNDAAEEANLNFSQLLQYAVRRELGMTDTLAKTMQGEKGKHQSTTDGPRQAT